MELWLRSTFHERLTRQQGLCLNAITYRALRRPWLQTRSESIHPAKSFPENPTADLFHHFSGLNVLPQELIDLLYGGTASLSDPFSAASINNLMMGPLFGSHGINNGLNVQQFLFIYLNFGEIFERANLREHGQYLL